MMASALGSHAPEVSGLPLLRFPPTWNARRLRVLDIPSPILPTTAFILDDILRSSLSSAMERLGVQHLGTRELH